MIQAQHLGSRGSNRCRAGLLLTCVMVLLTSLPATSANAEEPVLLAACSVYELEREPASWSPGCVGASPFLQNLQWSNWGAPTATATGEVMLNDCEPSCAEGTAYVYPAQMSAYRVRSCQEGGRSHRQYTQVLLSWSYPPDNPFEAPPGPSTFGPLRTDSNDCRRDGEPFHDNRGQAAEIAVAAANLTLSRKDWDIYDDGSVTRASKCHRIGRARFACRVFARASDLHGFGWWRGRMRIGIGKRKASWHWQGRRRKCGELFSCGPRPFDWRGTIGEAGVSLYN
jgi:hypothetical protein